MQLKRNPIPTHPAHPRGSPGLLLAALLVTFHVAAQPSITTAPKDQTVSLGASVSLNVSATTDTYPLSFQWWFGTTALENATNRILTLTNLESNQAGGYFVVVSNSAGSVTSRVATLTVDSTFQKIVGQPIAEDVEASIIGAWCDYDRDGLLDLFVANSMSGSGARNTLYRQNPVGVFSRVTNAITTRVLDTWAANWGDYDNDGVPDLCLGHPGGALEIVHSDGKGAFTVLPTSLFKPGAGLVGGAWIDLEGDGWLDLVAGAWDMKHCAAFRNLGDSRFQPLTTNEVGALVAKATSGGPCFADFDNDGNPDAYVGSDSGLASLYRNRGGGVFEAVQLGSVPSKSSTLGGVWVDYNNDGFFDLLTTARTGSLVLHRNNAGQEFEDVTLAAGLAGVAGPIWGPAWGDSDNDGDLDLFIPRYSTTNTFFRNNGDGTFTAVDIGSPLGEGSNDEFAVFVDYDNDGFLDLFVAAGEAAPAKNLLYRNNLKTVGNTNHWLEIQLTGRASNAQGIGAKIWVRATINGKEVWQLRQIASDGSNPFLAHFGLGDATMVDLIRIEWPSGNVQEVTSSPVDYLRTLVEPIRIQPVRPTASLGGGVTLTNNYLIGKYQWQFQDEDLPGQTNRTLTLTNLQASQAGRYCVVVTKPDQTTVANYTYVNVDTTFTKINDQPMVQNTDMSWGCAWVDYNNDGYSDLFVSGVGKPVTGAYTTSNLYRNNRDGSFTKMTAGEVGEIVADVFLWYGCSWGDYDNDGNIDLLLAGNDFNAKKGGGAALFRNNGDGTFTRQRNAGPFVTDTLYAQSAPWADYNRDGFLDLIAASGGTYNPTYQNALYRNQRNGTFTKVTEGPIVTDKAVSTELAVWGDYDGDGYPDPLITDFGAGRILLYHNLGSGRFERVTNNAIGSYRGIPGTLQTALGPAWADYDNDGELDLFMSCYNAPSRLFHNEGQGEFTSLLLGDTGAQTGSAAWGDYDNDGYLDLFIPRGQGTRQVNLLYHNNRDGTFTPIQQGSLVSEAGESMAGIWGDYDNDGFLDLFVSRVVTPPNLLYHNNGNGNGWLQVKLNGTASNRSAIGAKVRVQARIWTKTFSQMREISGGNRAQDDLRAHFGLGDATKATTLRIEWPSGAVQEFANVAKNQSLTVWEPPYLRAETNGDGDCVLSITAEPNRPWVIQASTDLVQWRELATLTSTTANLCYTDTSGMDCRFYRVVAP
jgi:hypothetical protein